MVPSARLLAIIMTPLTLDGSNEGPKHEECEDVRSTSMKVFHLVGSRQTGHNARSHPIPSLRPPHPPPPIFSPLAYCLSIASRGYRTAVLTLQPVSKLANLPSVMVFMRRDFGYYGLPGLPRRGQGKDYLTLSVQPVSASKKPSHCARGPVVHVERLHPQERRGHGPTEGF